jgi:hypothetical protein
MAPYAQTVFTYQGTHLVINQCEDKTHGCQDSCQFIEPGIYQCLCDDLNAHVYDFKCICNQGYSGDGNECTGKWIFNPCVKKIFLSFLRA